MFTRATALEVGCVAARGASIYVVHKIDGNEVTLLSVERHGEIRHRADVRPKHWTDLAASGLPHQELVIRCVPLRSLATGLTRLGVVSSGLRDSLANAVKMELAIRAYEDGPSIRSNLTASTASRGRQVKACRYG